jgi:hypothetical protein
MEPKQSVVHYCTGAATTHIILKVNYFQLIGRQLNGQWQLIEIEIEKQAPIN